MKRNIISVFLISFILFGFFMMMSCESPSTPPTPTETKGEPSTGTPGEATGTKAPDKTPTDGKTTGEPTKAPETGKPGETPTGKPSGKPTGAAGTPEATPKKTETPVVEAADEKAPAKAIKPISGKITIGMLLVNDDVGGVRDRFKKLEKEGKVTLIFKKSGLDSKKQEAIAKELVDKKVNALILNPRDSFTGDKIIKMAAKKNVPVFGLEMPMSDEAVSQVTFYMPQAGVKAANYMAEQIGKKGTVLVLSTDRSVEEKKMAELFKKTAEDISGDIKVKIINVMGDKKDTNKEIKKALTENKDIAGVFGVNNEISVPAANMLNGMKKTSVIVVGFTGGHEAMKAIKKYDFYKGDVKNDIKNIGKEAEKVVMKYLRDGEQVPRHIYLDYKIMDRESIKEVK